MLLNALPQVVERFEEIVPQHAAFPAALAAIIPAVAGLLGNIIGGLLDKKSTSNANESNQQFAESMHGLQRSEALADWNMQTEYNSPTSQMARLRQAGLNPILAAGNISSSSPSVRSSDTPSYTARPNNLGSYIAAMGGNVQSGLTDYYNIQQQEAQTDNLKAQNSAILQDVLLKKAQTIATLNSSDKIKVDTSAALNSLQQSQALFDGVFIKQNLDIERTRQDIQIANDRNLREASANSSSLKEAAERILTLQLGRAKTQDERAEIRQRIQNLATDNELKRMDINLKKAGIQPGDNAFNRMLLKLLNETGFAPGGSILSGAQRFSDSVNTKVKRFYEKAKKTSYPNRFGYK